MLAHRRIERVNVSVKVRIRARRITALFVGLQVRRLPRQHLVKQVRELHGVGEACDIGGGGIGIAGVVACDGRRGCEGGTCSTCVFGIRMANAAPQVVWYAVARTSSRGCDGSVCSHHSMNVVACAASRTAERVLWARCVPQAMTRLSHVKVIRLPRRKAGARCRARRERWQARARRTEPPYVMASEARMVAASSMGRALWGAAAGVGSTVAMSRAAGRGGRAGARW